MRAVAGCLCTGVVGVVLHSLQPALWPAFFLPLAGSQEQAVLAPPPVLFCSLADSPVLSCAPCTLSPGERTGRPPLPCKSSTSSCSAAHLRSSPLRLGQLRTPLSSVENEPSLSNAQESSHLSLHAKSSQLSPALYVSAFLVCHDFLSALSQGFPWKLNPSLLCRSLVWSSWPIARALPHGALGPWAASALGQALAPPDRRSPGSTQRSLEGRLCATQG